MHQIIEEKILSHSPSHAEYTVYFLFICYWKFENQMIYLGTNKKNKDNLIKLY